MFGSSNMAAVNILYRVKKYYMKRLQQIQYGTLLLLSYHFRRAATFGGGGGGGAYGISIEDREKFIFERKSVVSATAQELKLTLKSLWSFVLFVTSKDIDQHFRVLLWWIRIICQEKAGDSYYLLPIEIIMVCFLWC